MKIKALLRFFEGKLVNMEFENQKFFGNMFRIFQVV